MLHISEQVNFLRLLKGICLLCQLTRIITHTVYEFFRLVIARLWLLYAHLHYLWLLLQHVLKVTGFVDPAGIYRHLPVPFARWELWLSHLRAIWLKLLRVVQQKHFVFMLQLGHQKPPDSILQINIFIKRVKCRHDSIDFFLALTLSLAILFLTV